jgi:MOSC domain-containing protein YiiM
MRSRFQAQPDRHMHLDVRQGEARAHHRTRAAPMTEAHWHAGCAGEFEVTAISLPCSQVNERRNDAGIALNTLISAS